MNQNLDTSHGSPVAQSPPLSSQIASPGVNSLSLYLAVVQLLFALVVLLSKMNGFQQLCGLIVMGTLALASLAAFVKLTSPSIRPMGARTSPSRPTVERPLPHALTPQATPEPELNEDAALSLIADLEDLPDRVRRLPFGIVMDFDEERFIYTLVKLKTAVKALIAARSAGPATSYAEPVVPAPGTAVPSAPSPADDQERMPTDLEPSGAPEAAHAPEDEHPSVPAEDVDVVASPTMAEASAAPPLQEASAAEHASAGPTASRAVAEIIAEARRALRSGEVEAAVSLLTNVGPGDVASAEASELLGIALFRLGDQEGALKALRAAVDEDPSRASAHYNLAVVLNTTGDTGGARLHADLALDLKPDYAAALQLRQRLSHAAGAEDAAVTAASRAVLPDPRGSAARP